MPARVNIPTVTRGLLIGLIVQSTISAAIRYRQWSKESDAIVPYLALIPQLSVIYPWTFVTATLLENNVFTFALAAATIFYGGRFLERSWTSSEFVKFLLVASLVPNVSTFGTLVTLFAMTGDTNWTLSIINGTIGLQSAFLVAFSQLVPAHTVTLFRGIISLRIPRFPILHLGAVLLLTLLRILSVASFLLAVNGFLASWVYLRFYKQVLPDLELSQMGSLRGDSSETFALAEFFPEPVRPLIATVSEQVFGVLVALRICSPVSAAAASSRLEANLQRGGGGGGARAEAERRRALALKALDQRLSGAAAGPGGNATKAAPMVPPTIGPSVSMQPQPSQPAMLGETNYVPEEVGKS